MRAPSQQDQPTASTIEENQPRLGGRLQFLEPASLLPAQRKLYDYLLETKLRWAEKSKFQGLLADGRMIGLFNVFLHTQKMSKAFNNWVDVETDHTSLAADVRQVIVLTVRTGGRGFPAGQSRAWKAWLTSGTKEDWVDRCAPIEVETLVIAAEKDPGGGLSYSRN